MDYQMDENGMRREKRVIEEMEMESRKGVIVVKGEDSIKVPKYCR